MGGKDKGFVCKSGVGNATEEGSWSNWKSGKCESRVELERTKMGHVEKKLGTCGFEAIPERKTYEDAKEYCEENDMELALPRSHEDNMMMFEAIKRVESRMKRAWGQGKHASYGLIWIDRKGVSPLTYENFSPAKYGRYFSQKDRCVNMITAEGHREFGMWHGPNNCDDPGQKYPFVCRTFH